MTKAQRIRQAKINALFKARRALKRKRKKMAALRKEAQRQVAQDIMTDSIRDMLPDEQPVPIGTPVQTPPLIDLGGFQHALRDARRAVAQATDELALARSRHTNAICYLKRAEMELENATKTMLEGAP